MRNTTTDFAWPKWRESRQYENIDPEGVEATQLDAILFTIELFCSYLYTLHILCILLFTLTHYALQTLSSHNFVIVYMHSLMLVCTLACWICSYCQSFLLMLYLLQSMPYIITQVSLATHCSTVHTTVANPLMYPPGIVALLNLHGLS